MSNKEKRASLDKMRNYWLNIASREEAEKEYKRLKERKENNDLVAGYELAKYNALHGRILGSNK